MNSLIRGDGERTWGELSSILNSDEVMLLKLLNERCEEKQNQDEWGDVVFLNRENPHNPKDISMCAHDVHKDIAATEAHCFPTLCI